MITAQERLGQQIIEMRKEKPLLTASQCHDNIILLTNLGYTANSSNGNGSH